MKAARFALCALLIFGVAACASRGPDRAKGGVHVVRKGETAWRISKRYGTTVEALARANGMSDPTQLRVGQRLVIPGGKRLRSGSGIWTSRDPRGRTPKLKVGRPLPGKVTSGFGMRGGAHHDGIDIPARRGTPIRAAESGRVIHSDARLAGYGNMVIIKHMGDLSTVYAHNRKNLVRTGQFVEKGQIIAEVGQTGRTTAPHLHFEVRRDGEPRNPLDYLE
jgi:murein DD-endopeptidase MepM/ murein hydrolase activator NlpD